MAKKNPFGGKQAVPFGKKSAGNSNSKVEKKAGSSKKSK